MLDMFVIHLKAIKRIKANSRYGRTISNAKISKKIKEGYLAYGSTLTPPNIRTNENIKIVHINEKDKIARFFTKGIAENFADDIKNFAKQYYSKIVFSVTIETMTFNNNEIQQAANRPFKW